MGRKKLTWLGSALILFATLSTSSLALATSYIINGDSSGCTVRDNSHFDPALNTSYVGKRAIYCPSLQSPKALAERSEHFVARALKLNNTMANVEIVVEPRNDIALKARGSTEALKLLNVHTDGDELVVTGPPSASAAGGTVVIGSETVVATGGSTAISVIGGSSSDKSTNERIQLRVAVPSGTPLTIIGLTGDVRAGDLRAPVHVLLEAGEVQLGRVGPAVLAVGGSGTIRVAEVTDKADLSLDGTGTIVIEGGSVQHLSARLIGTGDIRADVTAQSADILFEGVGTIDVARVLNKPKIRENGVGTVEIGR